MIFAVVLKFVVSQYGKLLSNEMCRDFIMSKQCGEPCLFGVINIAPKA